MDQDVDLARCLFCLARSSDPEENLSHMSRVHSFFVPEQHRLQVDMDTLIVYLDLVISTYHQCLYCMSQRSNADAVRQHMVAKGHCRIDVASQDSEFQDFYEIDVDHAGEGEERTRSSATESETPAPPLSREDDGSILLPSGATIFSRTGSLSA